MDAKIAASKVQTGLHNVDDTELFEIYTALKGNEEYKAQFNKLMHVAGSRLKSILDADEKEQTQNKEGTTSVNTTEEQIVSRNLTQLETLEQVNPLDENNQEFATSRAYLNNMVVVDEKGKQVDISSNIIEVAKLKTVSDLVSSSEPISQESYNARLRDNIDLSIYGILTTNMITTSGNSPQTIQQSMSALLDGKKQTVTTASASGILSTQIVSLSKFADNLATKFKNLNLAQKFKAKVEQANANLTQKLKETYVKARTYAQILQEQGVFADVGMAFVAGVGGPVGMAAYGAWTYYRRVHPLYKAYREEKKNNPEVKNFWKYLGQHKKDAMFAGLYMASSVASFGVAGVAVAQAFTQGTNLAHTAAASVAPLVQAKAAIAFSTVGARCATDIAQAWGTPDRDKAIKRSLLSIGMSAVGYGFAHYLASSHGDITPSEHTQTPAASEHNDFNYVAKPDSQEVQGFKPMPWQETMSDNAPVEANHAAIDGTANVQQEVSVADAPTHEYTVGAREQAVYERNLKIVDKSDIMVANVEDDIVKLPKGMTPEMAVNLARVQMLYYGDDTGLKILLDCDEVSKISSTGYFDNLASKFTDSCTEPYGVGFPKDPNYGYVDPNIYTRSIEVDCDKTILHGSRLHHVTHPVTPTPEAMPKLDIPNLASETPKFSSADAPTIPNNVPSMKIEPVKVDPIQVEPLEQPHLEGKGGNLPLNEDINGEALRIGARDLGADGEGNVVRVDTEQNHAQTETPKGKVPTSGKGSENLSQALKNIKLNTFDM